MVNKFKASLQLNMQSFSDKEFKVVSDTIRSAIKNEHGFRAQKGITDLRLKKWPIVIRFTTHKNRDSFESVLRKVFNPLVLKKLAIKHLIPQSGVTSPVRRVVGQ